ncbi:MAG: biopolymer transporter ExbD [Rhodoferax sp.]|nr:biopolymer transporter ExbD [Rhodoferax sp.]
MAIDFEAVGEGDEGMLSDINTTPLVDVMLVLLIIFLITIPVINTSVAVKLPKQSNQLQQARPETVVITVDASGRATLFDTLLTSAQALQERLARIASQSPQPELHIRGDARANYEAVARVLVACQQAGITRIGFVTEPPPLDR